MTIVHRTSSILFLERYIKKQEKDPIVKRETEPDSDGPVANKQTKIQDLLLGKGVGRRGLRMREQSTVSQVRQSQCPERRGRQASVSSRLVWHVPDYLGLLRFCLKPKTKAKNNKEKQCLRSP